MGISGFWEHFMRGVDDPERPLGARGPTLTLFRVPGTRRGPESTKIAIFRIFRSTGGPISSQSPSDSVGGLPWHTLGGPAALDLSLARDGAVRGSDIAKIDEKGVRGSRVRGGGRPHLGCICGDLLASLGGDADLLEAVAEVAELFGMGGILGAGSPWVGVRQWEERR